jgi:hypothetical protein
LLLTIHTNLDTKFRFGVLYLPLETQALCVDYDVLAMKRSHNSWRACAKHAARWLVHAGVLDQFRVAAEIAEEDIKEYKAFPAAEEW